MSDILLIDTKEFVKSVPSSERFLADACKALTDLLRLTQPSEVVLLNADNSGVRRKLQQTYKSSGRLSSDTNLKDDAVKDVLRRNENKKNFVEFVSKNFGFSIVDAAHEIGDVANEVFQRFEDLFNKRTFVFATAGMEASRFTSQVVSLDSSRIRAFDLAKASWIEQHDAPVASGLKETVSYLAASGIPCCNVDPASVGSEQHTKNVQLLNFVSSDRASYTRTGRWDPAGLLIDLRNEGDLDFNFYMELVDVFSKIDSKKR